MLWHGVLAIVKPSGDISDGDAPTESDGDMDAENDTGDEELREIIACDHDFPCPIPYRCDYATGYCEVRRGFCLDSRDCETNQGYCEAYPGYDYGRCRDLCYLPDVPCPTGASCCQQDDPRRICQGYEGRCVNPNDMPACIREEDCPAAFYCDWPGGDIVQGHCLPRCYSHPDCPEDLVCRNDQHCGADMQDGDCGGDCPGGHICHPLYNTCVENCPPCGPMEYCNPETAPECMACVNPDQCGVMMAPCCPGYKCSATVYGIVGSCIMDGARMKHVLTIVALFAVALGMFACGESISLRFCDPGETKDCTCDNGAEGEITCQPNGLAWSVCECGDDVEPDGDDFDLIPGERCSNPGERRCMGSVALACSSNGVWVYLEDCAETAEQCLDGACRRITADGDIVDNDISDSSDDVVGEMEPASDGAEEGGCSPGEVRCDGTAVEVCSNSFTWVFLKDCAATGEQCRDGVCVTDPDGDTADIDGDLDAISVSDQEPDVGSDAISGCTPDEYRCIDTVLEVCTPGFTWVFIADCAASGRWCRDGECSAEEPCGGPCPEGYVCDTVFNQCVLDCPDCGPGECCDAQSAPHCYPCGECVNPPSCDMWTGWPPCCPGYICVPVMEFIGSCTRTQEP